ncbi:MAG: J domain-containing protein [Oscillospiraceae bacterium]|nr:J domain-containing protein [Oscillospiraceae bacterium]
MKSPYEILGVSPSASDDEVKQAYRALAKKYHPDKYADSPLADLASEKMSEINAAYDQIQDMRKGKNAGPGYGGFGGGFNGGFNGAYSQNSQQSGPFADIRRLIAIGRIFEADELLNGIPAASRDAEWYYLKGRVLHSRGFLEDSMICFQRAVQMNPQNEEYRQWYTAMQQQRAGGYQTVHASQINCNNLCTTLLCMQCLCGGSCCYYPCFCY